MVRPLPFPIMSMLLMFCAVSWPLALRSAKERLQKSHMYLNKGDYQLALSELDSLDIQHDLDNSDDMSLALKIRAIAHQQIGDKDKARLALMELFSLDPDYELDPFDTPRSVVELAKKEKALIEEKNQRLALIKSELAQKKSSTTKSAVVITKAPNHVAGTLFPLGLNHFYLNSPKRGVIYLTLQSLGLITNIAAFWWKQSYMIGFGRPRLSDESNRNGFRAAQTVQILGLGVLLAGYGISVVDALIGFADLSEQRVVTEKKDLIDFSKIISFR